MGPYQSEHTIDIAAPRESVWPWVVQIGQDRGGFYSYTWLENAAGCHVHNADRLVPEWQERQVGDRVPLHPKLVMDVVAVEPPHRLVLRAPDRSALWSFTLLDGGDGTTLVIRFRMTGAPPGLRLVHWVMERRMLHGIKERAERLSGPSVAPRPTP